MIAQANGLQSDSDLRAGQTVNIPNQVTGASNSASTYKPYDPSKIKGDTTPTLPQPAASGGGGCGGIGQLLMVIVAVAVTVYTGGAALGAFGTATAAGGTALTGAAASAAFAAGTATWTAGSLAIAGALGGAAGSIASQSLESPRACKTALAGKAWH